MENGSGVLPFGIAAIDTMLGGGLMRGALHEIAASAEAHSAAATGFALGLAALCTPSPRLFWIAEEMARVESGVPHGAGLDAFGLAPERLVTVSVTHRRDLLWGMEEALRCRAVGVVIGEMRAGKIDADRGAAALARRRRERRAGAVAARRTSGRQLHRRHPLDRRRRVVFAIPGGGSPASEAVE